MLWRWTFSRSAVVASREYPRLSIVVVTCNSILHELVRVVFHKKKKHLSQKDFMHGKAPSNEWMEKNERLESGVGEFKLMTLGDARWEEGSRFLSPDEWIAFGLTVRKGEILEKSFVSFPRCVRNCALGWMMVIVLLFCFHFHSVSLLTWLSPSFQPPTDDEAAGKYSSKANRAKIRWNVSRFVSVSPFCYRSWSYKWHEALSQETIWVARHCTSFRLHTPCKDLVECA